MKKLLTAILCTSLLLVVTGCSSSNKDDKIKEYGDQFMSNVSDNLKSDLPALSYGNVEVKEDTYKCIAGTTNKAAVEISFDEEGNTTSISLRNDAIEAADLNETSQTMDLLALAMLIEFKVPKEVKNDIISNMTKLDTDINYVNEKDGYSKLLSFSSPTYTSNKEGMVTVFNKPGLSGKDTYNVASLDLINKGSYAVYVSKTK